MGPFQRIPVAAYIFVTCLLLVIMLRPRFSELETSKPSAPPPAAKPSPASIFDIGIRFLTFYSHISFPADPLIPFDFDLGFPLTPIAQGSETPTVLVLVTTTASEWKMRSEVRDSWANSPNKTVRVEFLMGRPVRKGER